MTNKKEYNDKVLTPEEYARKKNTKKLQKRGKKKKK